VIRVAVSASILVISRLVPFFGHFSLGKRQITSAERQSCGLTSAFATLFIYLMGRLHLCLISGLFLDSLAHLSVVKYIDVLTNVGFQITMDQGEDSGTMDRNITKMTRAQEVALGVRAGQGRRRRGKHRWRESTRLGSARAMGGVMVQCRCWHIRALIREGRSDDWLSMSRGEDKQRYLFSISNNNST
jgi:hypothetical protein